MSRGHVFLRPALVLGICFGLSGLCEVSAQPNQGRLGSVRDSSAAREPATRPITGSDLSRDRGVVDGLPSDGPMLSPFLIVKPPSSSSSSSRPYSDVEYSRIVRSLMDISRVPMAINYTPGQSILPDGFERSVLKAGTSVRSIRTKAIDVLDRGLMVVPTRETVRLRGVRIPSQFTGTESSRAAGREATRILREMVRSGDLEVLPGLPVRDPSGSILVEIHLEGGDTLNALLIRQGLAMTEPSDYDTVGTPMAANLQGLQTEARRNQMGLWARR